MKCDHPRQLTLPLEAPAFPPRKHTQRKQTQPRPIRHSSPCHLTILSDVQTAVVFLLLLLSAVAVVFSFLTCFLLVSSQRCHWCWLLALIVLRPQTAVRSLAVRGRYLVVGFASGTIPSPPLNLVLLREACVMGVFWGAWREREPDERYFV